MFTSRFGHALLHTQVKSHQIFKIAKMHHRTWASGNHHFNILCAKILEKSSLTFRNSVSLELLTSILQLEGNFAALF